MADKSPYSAMRNALDYERDDNIPAPPAYSPATANGLAPAPAPPTATSSTVTNIQTIAPPFGFVSSPSVGPNSMELQCPQCRSRVKTKIRHRATAKTHIACLLLSWTCCLCCLPYCMDSCRNTNHFCPMCGSFIGTYQS